MNAAIIGLVALAAISLGLRTTAVLLGPAVHPLVRLAALDRGRRTDYDRGRCEICDSYGVFELGLGLLLVAVAGWRVRPREMVVQVAAQLTR